MRCVPCVECVKLDDEIVESHPKLQQLLKQFVRVRLISTNGLDLSLFQFDTDQSFNVMMFHSDGTIYGRYGTRSHREHWEDDVSVDGMAEALQGALELHAKLDQVREVLKAKKGPAPLYASPEKFPNLATKYGPKLDTTDGGKLVKSCIHCHQIGDAIKQHYRNEEGSLPPQVLFPYPHPKAIGIILDPKTRATVRQVTPSSPAEASGLREGDVIETMNQQPILSMADVQWVLHQSADQNVTIPLKIKRSGESKEIALALPSGWKGRDDLAWRASSWELRRMGLGGLFLQPQKTEGSAEAKELGDRTVMRVQHVGQFAPHDVAKKAGLQKEDIVISIDGRTDFQRETDILYYALNQKKPGDLLQLEVMRQGKKIQIKLPVPTVSKN